jgi:catechol 2,3-dioxygenase-like lactoylglutathione lyase family enzyme
VTDIPRDVGAITMFIEDVQRSKRWYESVFDIQPVYEDENAVAFAFDHIVINLLREPAAHELIEPALVGSAESGSRFQLTIEVDDCDATVAELTSRGAVLINGPMDREWGLRTACFADPDGHIWEVAENIQGGGAPAT